MKPEDKVCTHNQSQYLLALGVNLKTEKYWVMNNNRNLTLRPVSDVVFKINDLHLEYNWIAVPAPDVAEMGEILLKNNYYLSVLVDNEYVLKSTINDSIFKRIAAKTEAEARAEALIFIIETHQVEL